MIKLEDLVPPLELCKQIPPTCFTRTALFWFFTNGEYWIGWRYIASNFKPEQIVAPAPTLAEILESDHRMTITRSHTGITWAAEVWDGSRWYARNAINSATAALKLWLEVNGIASDPSEASDETPDAGHNSEEVEK